MHRFNPHRLPLIITALAILPVSGTRAVDSTPFHPKASVTFTKDIAPVVFANCITCHRPAEVAPFSLLTYIDVKKHAKQIAQVTSSLQMPPWKAVAGHGEFRDERRLSTHQIALFKQWADAGTPEGNPKDLPALPKFKVGWQLGEPDLIVTMPKSYQVAAEGRDIYRNFAITLEVPAGKFIRAVEYRPSNRRVVHHAIFSSETTGKGRALDGKDGAPGFTSGSVSGQMFPGESGFWVPGKETRPLPEGVSFAWPKGADFMLQLHLHPSGKPEIEQSTIGFYFTSEPPHRSFGAVMLNDTNIHIQPGDKSYHTRAEKTLNSDAELYGIFPHMHLIGKEVKVTAILPDGTTQSLLQIDNWDFNWQSYYEYAKPLFLPRGTRVVMENTHDNSAENLANPNHPPQMINAGEQTTNEMSAVLIQYFPKGPAASPTTRGSGSVMAAAKANPADYLAEANKAIKLYDKDGDGKLSLEELQKIPAAANLDVPAFIKRFDRDGDGKINAAELAEAIMTLQPH